MEPTVFSPERVTIVGVLNVTPDSFSDGGRFVAPGDQVDVPEVLRVAQALVGAGAHVLDVGGESTRPGADAVSVAAEIDRTARVVEALVKEFAVAVSIDTRKAPVAEAALEAGASIVNDVSGGSFDGRMFGVVAERGASVVIGHARTTPDRMQREISFVDVVAEVADELVAAVSAARAAGVAASRIAVDPGIGFGKRLPENLALLANLPLLRARAGCPVWVGVSRKSFLGELTGDAVEERDLAGHVASGIAVFEGADAVRVHDVAGARRAVAVGQALRAARRPSA